jgi:hypothetical protein
MEGHSSVGRGRTCMKVLISGGRSRASESSSSVYFSTASFMLLMISVSWLAFSRGVLAYGASASGVVEAGGSLRSCCFMIVLCFM